MPISILNFSRAWQSYFLRYALENLITYGFFIDKKMMFYSFFCIFNKKAEIWEKLLFLLQNSPQMVKKVMIMDYDYSENQNKPDSSLYMK